METLLLVHEMRRERVLSLGPYRTRESVVVRVMDEEGVVGWGEGYMFPGTVATLREVSALVVGQQPEAFGAVWNRVAGASNDMYATSAVAIALEDLRARRAQIPVSALFRGTLRDRVRAYASSGGYFADEQTDVTWPVECQTLIDRGFTAIKLRMGRDAPRRELPLAVKLRELIPEHVDLMADANGAMTVADAVVLGEGLEELGFLWLEEPLPQRPGYLNYERLRSSITLPLAAGETLETRAAVLDFLRRGCADILQPDVTICGGIGELLFHADLAMLHGVRCIPHAWGGGIALAATLQAIAALPLTTPVGWASELLLEYDVAENPFRTGMLVDPVQIESGYAKIPQGPGLGVDVDEAWIRAHAITVPSSS